MKVMNIELSELGRHEAWLRISSIMKAGDTHIQMERKLTSELIKNWRETYEDTLKELFRQIPSEISSKAVEIIMQRLAEALGQSFGSSQKVREEFRKYITRAYQSGKSEFTVKPELNLSDIRAIDVLTKHNCYWLGEHYGKHIGSKIAELTQNALRDGLGRDELAKELREALGGKAGGYKYWDVVSSAALVRSRSFGCVSGMVEAGITEYEILAMADERMCPICGEMNGQTFSVAETQKVIDRTLSISDPDKFKEAMPWHTEPPTGISKDKLIADGMSIPPFHGRCRCTLVMAETAEVIEVNIEEKLAQLQAKDSEYEKEYNRLEYQLQEAVSSKDEKRYSDLLSQQSEIVSKWRALGSEIRAAKIEAAKQGIIFASGLSNKLGEADIKAIIEAVKSAPEDVRKVWNIMESKMKIADTSTSDSYYSPQNSSVYINIAHDRVLGSRPAYSVIFHELGHLIDNKVTSLGNYSCTSKYGLFNVLKSEVDEYVNSRLKQLKAGAFKEGKSPREIKKSNAYASVEKELCKLPIRSSISVSDLFSGMTFNKCKDNWGHSTSYWRKNPELSCMEFFAQVYSDSIVNPEGIETIKRYAPKSYAIFKKMLKDIVEQ